MMNTQKLFSLIKFLAGGLLVLFLLGYLILSMESLPSQPENAPYPPPESLLSSTPTQTTCDQMYGFLLEQEVPPDKEDDLEQIKQQYLACLEALNAPYSDSPKPVSTPVPYQSSTTVFQRPAGIGMIVELDSSIFSSGYLVVNQWHAEQDGKRYGVYAGAQRNDPSQGGKTIEQPWPGILAVIVQDSYGNTLKDEGGIFFTPIRAGTVRIVGAEGTILTTVAEDGTVFTFDVINHQYLSTELNSLTSRTVGVGTIIESSDTPLSVEDYSFENYWVVDNLNSYQITVMAGFQGDNNRKGAFMVVVSPASDPGTILEETAYVPSYEGGSLRIVDAKDTELTLVTDFGLVYVFDVTSRQLTSMMPKTTGEEFEVISLIGQPEAAYATPTNTPSFGTQPAYTVTVQATLTITPTKTPTRTPTPTRTKTPTPFPTLNPYP